MAAMRSSSFRRVHFAAASLLLASYLSNVSWAWISPLPLQAQSRPFRTSSSLASSSSSSSHNDSTATSNDVILRRTRIAGVSVSDMGFWVILQFDAEKFLPLQVTTPMPQPTTGQPPHDTDSATSPRALTILQLLAKVDMAGAILPPDLLPRMLLLDMEQSRDDADAPDTARQKPTRMPIATLDEVQLVIRNAAESDGRLPFEFRLQCSGRDLEDGKRTLVLPSDILEQVDTYTEAYQPPDATAVFTTIALALRYKAPLVLQLESNDNDDEMNSIQNDKDETATDNMFVTSFRALQERFPLYRSFADLQKTSDRSSRTIEQGFQINQLQAALTIARAKGDRSAAAKIRAKLDQMDSLDNLPTLPDSDIDSME